MFEAREIVDMYKDVVHGRGGSDSENNYLAKVRDEIDAYRAERGWSEHGFGNEPEDIPTPRVIEQIRHAYDEVLADENASAQFKYGMRYVMCLLDMPEGVSLRGDGGGTRDMVALSRRAHYVSTYCIHNDHKSCRHTCKTCDAPCRCECHV